MRYTRRFFGPAFDWHWFKAQAYAESALNPSSVSWVGARGIMQLMPMTYREIKSQEPDFGPIDSPEWNIAAGIFYNSKLWSWWHFVPDSSRYHFMFGSYNAGTGNIYRAFSAAVSQYNDSSWNGVAHVAPTIHGWRYTETLAYVRHIDTTYYWLNHPFTGIVSTAKSLFGQPSGTTSSGADDYIESPRDVASFSEPYTGRSIDGLRGVNICGPFSVMCKQSSSRIPNSP